jgi:hypothetical protein
MSGQNIVHCEVKSIGWPNAKTLGSDLRSQVSRVGPRLSAELGVIEC